MYACICQGLREKDVRNSVQRGARSAGDVFKSHGCKPDCGKCVNSIRKTVKDEMKVEAPLIAAE